MSPVDFAVLVTPGRAVKVCPVCDEHLTMSTPDADEQMLRQHLGTHTIPMDGRDVAPWLCRYADEHALTVVMYDDLRMCGCGQPTEVLALVLDLLRRFAGTTAADAAGMGGPAFEFIAHQLDAAGLIDHGSSISTAHVTGKGRWLLALVERRPELLELEDHDEHGYACSDCPPPDSERA